MNESFDNWKDPWPKPVIEVIQGIHVVRDDYIQFGSKVRFIDYLIGHDPETRHVKEWVFGSCPAQGYAQIGLPVVCNKYGKKAVLFMAKRAPEKYHEYQKRGLALGAEYNWVNMGMLTVTEKRAKDYVAEDPIKRRLLPIGLDHPSVIKSIERVARDIGISPSHVWSVGSSGTLSRGLQSAWGEKECEHHVVSAGGHKGNYGSAIYHEARYKFNQPVKPEEAPPFPSAPEYDAKAWYPMLEWHKTHKPKGPVLFWNVGA